MALSESGCLTERGVGKRGVGRETVREGDREVWLKDGDGEVKWGGLMFIVLTNLIWDYKQIFSLFQAI